MAISVASHGALLLLVSWLVSTFAVRSVSYTVLAFSLQPGRTAAVSRAQTAADGRLTERVPVGQRDGETAAAAETAVRSDRESGATNTPDTANAKEAHGRDSRGADTPEAELTLIPETIVLIEAATAHTMEALDISTSIVGPEPRTPVSEQQEKMLNRRLEQWSEKLQEIPVGTDCLTWRHQGRDYEARVTRLPADEDVEVDRVLVRVSTQQNGTRYSTEMEMGRLSFSSYAQFVNRWDPSVSIHDDEFDGRVHSNTAIGLTYDRRAVPRFHAKVTTAARDINVRDDRQYLRHEDVFLGGLQTGVRTIPMPKRYVPFPGEDDPREGQLHHFEHDTSVTFYPDGSFGWRTVPTDDTEHRVTFSEDIAYLIAAEKTTLHVRGTVNGKVLVYSPECIVIEGNLVYAEDPSASPDADDYLGLVSDKYVEIADPEVTGPGDLVIQAAIYAKRRFIVRRHRDKPGALLHVYGSLTVDSLSATEPRYATRIRFDPRLATIRPPRFPMTDRYEVLSWDRTWESSASDASL